MKDRNKLKNKSDLNDLKTDLEKAKISANLRENEKYLRERLENCSDILIRPMKLGDHHKVDCLMVYIEVAVSNMMLDDSAIGKMINHFWEIFPGSDTGIRTEQQSGNCRCKETEGYGRSHFRSAYRRCGLLYGRL